MSRLSWLESKRAAEADEDCGVIAAYNCEMRQDQPIPCQKIGKAGIPCDRTATLSSTHEVYRKNQAGEQYLHAIHYVIICPHCGAYVHVENVS